MNINNKVLKYKKDGKSAKEMHRLSNCIKVLYYIKSQGSITANQAREVLGVNRLAARIYDLRENHKQNIQTHMIYGNNEKFALYAMGEES